MANPRRLFESGTAKLLESGDVRLLEFAAPITALSIAPGRLSPSTTATLSFIGTGTAWLSGTPTFSATGAPAGDGSWLLGAKTIVDDTHATLVVTTGPTVGTVVWTDSTTSRTTTMAVARRHHSLVFRRR